MGGGALSFTCYSLLTLRIASLSVAASGQFFFGSLRFEKRDGVVQTPSDHERGDKSQASLHALHGEWLDACTEFVELVLGNPQERNRAETEGEREFGTFCGRS